MTAAPNTLQSGQASLDRLTAGHPNAMAALRDLILLQQEVRAIARTGMLPDGDSVNTSTLIWAEDWTRK